MAISSCSRLPSARPSNGKQANKVTNVFLSKAAFFTHQVAIM